MSINHKDVLDLVRPVMRMIDRPIALSAETINGNTQIRQKYHDNGILVATRTVPGLPGPQEVYLTRGGDFVKANLLVVKQPHGGTHTTRDLTVLSEDEVARYVDPRELKAAVAEIFKDRLSTTLDKAQSIGSRLDALYALDNKETMQHVG